MKGTDPPHRRMAAMASMVLAIALMLMTGCNAASISGPEFDRPAIIQSLNDGRQHEARNEHVAAPTLGGKHESRNENGVASEEPGVVGGKHESRNENGAAGGKHESRNENG